MKYKLFITSIIGWTIALIVFVISFFGINLSNTIPCVWLLHVGVFIVFAPAIYFAKDNPRVLIYEDNDEGISLTPFFKNAPILILAMIFLSIIFAIYGFMSSSISNNGNLEFVNGNYILKNEEIIKSITVTEYNKLKAGVWKSFSGMWLIFYSISILIFCRLIEWEKDELKT